MPVKRIAIILLSFSLVLPLAGCTKPTPVAAPPPGTPGGSTPPTGTAPPAAETPAWQESLNLSISMVDEANGWALDTGWTRSVVLRTSDGGAAWQDVTPQGVELSPNVGATFRSATTGWVAEPIVEGTGKGPWEFYVYRTTDGGQTWEKAVVTVDYPLVQAELDFLDARRGWIMAIPQRGMSSSPGRLFTTEDGGRTWTLVASTQGEHPGLPLGGDLRFTGPETGWLVGSYEATGIRHLFTTMNGGRTWQELVFTPPGDFATSDFLGTPVFSGPKGQDGILAATYRSAGNLTRSLGIHITHDGGETWRPRPLREDLAPLVFVNARRGWAQGRDGFYRTDDGGLTWTALRPDRTLQGLLVDHTLASLDFVTEQVGWATLSSAPWKNVKQELLKTTDGGQTWERIDYKVALHGP